VKIITDEMEIMYECTSSKSSSSSSTNSSPSGASDNGFSDEPITDFELKQLGIRKRKTTICRTIRSGH